MSNTASDNEHVNEIGLAANLPAATWMKKGKTATRQLWEDSIEAGDCCDNDYIILIDRIESLQQQLADRTSLLLKATRVIPRYYSDEKEIIDEIIQALKDG